MGGRGGVGHSSCPAGWGSRGVHHRTRHGLPWFCSGRVLTHRTKGVRGGRPPPRFVGGEPVHGGAAVGFVPPPAVPVRWGAAVACGGSARSVLVLVPIPLVQLVGGLDEVRSQLILGDPQLYDVLTLQPTSSDVETSQHVSIVPTHTHTHTHFCCLWQ